MTDYPYAGSDPRGDRARYFYAPFAGPSFLAAYRASREAAIRGWIARAGSEGGLLAPATAAPAAAASVPPPGSGVVDTASLVAAIRGGADDRGWLPILARTFELARVLRASYGPDRRPVDRAEPAADAYADLALGLARVASVRPPDLGLASTLLKLGDHLAFRHEELSEAAARIAALAFAIELDVVEAIRSSVASEAPVDEAVRWADPEDPGDAAAPSRDQGPRRVALLTADTPRARAYLAALVETRMPPDRAILVTVPDERSTSLAEALRRAGVPFVEVCAAAFDDPTVLTAIAHGGGEELVVAAPPAGVLLAPAFFAIRGRRYLHVHPGRLPAYRGSTPMYYELLAEGRLTATALLLDEGIDTGTVLAEQGFAVPADRSTIDGSVDPLMRATLLRAVVGAWRAGSPLRGRPQPDGGRAFHVIHPVLRHLAILGPSVRDAGARQGVPGPRPGTRVRAALAGMLLG